jgi:hypothetical protein
MLLRSFKNLKKSVTEKTREDKQGAKTHPLQIVDHSVPAAIGRNMGGLIGGVSNVLKALLENARSPCSQQAQLQVTSTLRGGISTGRKEH